MPRERPRPEPFEPASLDRSLNRYLTLGLVFMVVLIGGFVVYGIREPSLRRDAAASQRVEYTKLGHRLFNASCADCHGTNAEGGADAPTLHSKQFLGSTSDEQMRTLISGGISGTEMPSWGIEFGGTMTDEQVREIVTYLRSLEDGAPSIPRWRSGATAK